MMKMEYTITNPDILKNVRAGLMDLSPAWRGPVREIFFTMMREQFKQEGAYTGEKWVPLNPAYAAWKARKYPDKGILQRMGYLHDSLTGSTEWSVFRSGPSFAEYGTRLVYAATHQYGDASRNIPQRQVIPTLSKAEGSRIADALLAFILGRARKSPTGPRVS
jgi:phage gpG-like protein